LIDWSSIEKAIAVCYAVLILIEAMKMKISVDAPKNGTVHRLLCRHREQITTGQIMAIIDNKARCF